MKRLLLSLGLALWASAALAQSSCTGFGGVNSVPQIGTACVQEPTTTSYAATGIAIVPAASATDIACITGSATRVVRVQQVKVNGTGTAIAIPIVLNKHASANTGGTAATGGALPVPYALDSTNVAATATTTAYTANPTIPDATPGVIDIQWLGLAATTTSTAGNTTFTYWDREFMQAITLRGIAQQLCVNLNATSPTASLAVSFKWTESVQ